ncbi:transcriptional regulator [Synechococcus sp. PCC 7502]|uniref:LysR family transcriptional regulator n=1 Tax=Synechococcus sp. PCC 7502 TaxID=1173263 RepID=UPI00029FE88C|nr:LysR family transcriptional regulator [Synechococcus sp. PCC 7502]AFY73236.1 transcriptional regulator [Synechococcus sp. PCC 7502]
MLDRLSCIQSFVRTVETGSFSAVAKELNTTQPTISKQIAALEEYLDVQLLVRSTRKVSLTDEGDRFYEIALQLLATLTEAESRVGKRQEPSGLLRVNCSVGFGQLQLVPVLDKFLSRYPQIKMDLTMADHYIDLVEEGIDLAIRIGTFSDRSLISEQIGETRLVTAAATSYFARFPEPKVPSDLIHHNCIVYTRQSTGNLWHYKGAEITVQGNLQVNNSGALTELVYKGLGIGTAPMWGFNAGLENKSLKLVLEDYEPSPLPVKVVYRRGRFISAKIKCFISFLKQELKF